MKKSDIIIRKTRFENLREIFINNIICVSNKNICKREEYCKLVFSRNLLFEKLP
jgi:hypothetical protein